MTPEHLVILMLVAPLLGMLFVVWGVRGPSRFTLFKWYVDAQPPLPRALFIFGLSARVAQRAMLNLARTFVRLDDAIARCRAPLAWWQAQGEIDPSD